MNILLIPDDESTPKNLKLRYSIITAGLIVLVFIGIGLLIGVFTYGQLLQKAYENISLKEENQQLQEQVSKVNDLTNELNALKSYGQKVRNSLTGYVKVNESVNLNGAQEAAATESPVTRSMVSILTSLPIKAPVTGFISQEYKPGIHNGVDIVAPEGTPVVAAGSGTVLFSGYTMDGGNTIIIGHGNGYYSYYKHNLRNLVYDNQQVESGEVIAYLGNSGQKSFGPHLHFEIWKDGHPIDPQKLIVNFNK